MNYPRKNAIYLKQVYTFQSNQIKFENPKSLLPLKRFITFLLTTSNPMGSPLAPVLANIFMCLSKSKQLNKYNLNEPKFYLRYIDETLAAFDKEQDSSNFLNFLNKSHPNIKFTIEKQVNDSIAFIDVFILGINNKISHFKHITNQPIQVFS